MGFIDRFKANPNVQKAMDKAKDPETQAKVKKAAQGYMDKRKRQPVPPRGASRGGGYGVPDFDDGFQDADGDGMDDSAEVLANQQSIVDPGDQEIADSGDFDDTADDSGDVDFGDSGDDG